MARFIVKIDGKYLEWSTVVDAPVTYGMTREEFEAYYRFNYGESWMEHLPERMARVEANGTSSFNCTSIEDVIAGNRAGDGEQELTLEQIAEKYCRKLTTSAGGAEKR